MAFTTYPLVATGDAWTSIDNNTYNRANINELWAYTTAGDMVYASSPTALSRIPVGSTGQVLTISGGVPVWSTGAPGIFEAEGDLLYGTGANAMARLAKGDNDDILSLNSGVPFWDTYDRSLYVTEVSHSTTCTISAYDTLFIPWNTEIVDDDSWHSTTVNNTRITVSDAGRYLLNSLFYCSAGVQTSTQVMQFINVYINGEFSFYKMNSLLSKYLGVDGALLDLDADDYVEIEMVNNHSSSMVVQPMNFTLVKMV